MKIERSGSIRRRAKGGLIRLAIIAGLGLPIAACDKNPEIIPQGEYKSPDGLWTVKSEVQRWSGPGNNYLAAEVLISQTGIDQEPTRILTLNIQDTSQGA